MPTAGQYGRATQNPFNTFHHFDRFGPSQSALAYFLFPFAWRDVVFWFDDFTQGRTTLTDDYTLGTDSGATAFVKNAGSGGRIQGSTGSTDEEAICILTGADWLGDQECGMEVRWQVDAVGTADLSFEAGFTDPLSDNTLPAVDDVDTPSVANGATDVAVIRLNQADTLKTEVFITDGVTANMNTTATALGTRIPTAAEYLSTRIQIITDAASGYHFGANYQLQESAQHGAVLASQIEGGTALTARFFGQTKTVSVPLAFTLDLIAIWQNRR